MTKIVFDLKQFEEWLKSIKTNNKYKLDTNESPIAILVCDLYSGGPAHPLYYKTYERTVVALSGIIEE